ncbi:gag-proteinase polyprotein [Cucumis melo var. makuwa]|uniref:Gag-proteinase polyprotein n=1 Tax=Cucumis melo var. makuwa TaxID=1194695 RepID=A0A5D3DQT4_CUCMM|nr:gag-proteinase polyprotein [Cucumis melo var. makuwa]TYK26013.1 gag-proteinase polyprotein [Cucumis melo var. makuwa]
MVQKVLRSLPSRFSMKVIAIEEANDITTIKLDELFRSLCTFKLHWKIKTNRDGTSSNSSSSSSTNVDFSSRKRDQDQGTSHKDKSNKSDKIVRCQECEGIQTLPSTMPHLFEEKEEDSQYYLVR